MTEITEIRKGFTCPDWALSLWDKDQCTVHPCREGGYAVVCHQAQTTIYLGTEEECYKFLGRTPEVCDDEED